jgi:hypothetical protein
VIDQQGLEMTGSAEAVAAYDRGIGHLVRFRPELIDDVAASTLDPSCAMGAVLGAYVALLSTEGAGVARARAALASATERDSVLVARERAHRAVIERWLAGDMHRAGALLNRLSVEYPRDLLALYVGHQIDFLTGNAFNLRDRIGRALSEWTRDDPGHGFLLGMYAFGLEECNQHTRAAEVGLRAVAAHAEDVWGLHAVVHTYEMQGEIPGGLRFLADRRADWTSDNFLRVHNSWHDALFALEGDDVDGALGVYDEVLHTRDSPDVAFELLDATSLLWRLALEDTPVGDRWRPLADSWSRVLVPGYYPFNDLHAVMAYVGAGDLAEARRIVAALVAFAERGDRSTSGWQMTARVGLPVCRSLVRFASGDYAGTLEDLLPIRGWVHEFGGSHAQRDVVERTLLEASIRAGRADLARALLSERISLRESSTYAWSKRAELLARTGDRDGLLRASVRADGLASGVRAAAGGRPG